MIRDRNELESWISADLLSSGRTRFTQLDCFKYPVLRYQVLLRRYEYFLNQDGAKLRMFARYYYRYRLHSLSYYLGIQIPPNVFGPGLCIVHHQGIVVSADSRVGKNCRIHAGVNIGAWRGKAPTLGNNVYIGPGAKLIGDIVVGDRCVIGANAVVCKSFPSDVTIAGVPASVISQKNSTEVILNRGA